MGIVIAAVCGFAGYRLWNDHRSLGWIAAALAIGSVLAWRNTLQYEMRERANATRNIDEYAHMASALAGIAGIFGGIGLLIYSFFA